MLYFSGDIDYKSYVIAGEDDSLTIERLYATYYDEPIACYTRTKYFLDGRMGVTVINQIRDHHYDQYFTLLVTSYRKWLDHIIEMSKSEPYITNTLRHG